MTNNALHALDKFQEWALDPLKLLETANTQALTMDEDKMTIQA